MYSRGRNLEGTSWNSTTLRNFSLQKIKSPFWLKLTQSGFYYFQLNNFKCSTMEKEGGGGAGHAYPEWENVRPNLGVLARFTISQ